MEDREIDRYGEKEEESREERGRERHFVSTYSYVVTIC
jgi:hypothetical protein